jgi:hypothetical protein
MDIEASGFGPESYPIEIGVVRSDGARYCKLIKPFDDWHHWDTSAENLHGISKSLLNEKGISGVLACLELNDFIGSEPTYSDGWVVDSPWLVKLYDRSQIELGFRLSSLEMILKERQFDVWDETKAAILRQLNIQRHRASNDAMLIQKTYIQTFNL